MVRIPYGKQFIDNSDIEFTKNSLKNEFITGGKKVTLFENDLKKKLNAKYCLVCNNATSGLYLSFKAIGVKKNDVIIMPSINFIASYSMANFLNAKIYLCDVDQNSGQITPETFLECLKKNKIKKIKALVTMYLGGYPNNIDKFYNLKKKFKFSLIEDACHALGSSFKIKNKTYRVGDNKYSDISIFSFHPIKPITTGEGGAITTGNKKIYEKLKILRNHGMLKEKNHWIYDIKELSFNFRLSDLNSALGISQLKKLSYFINTRRKIFKIYKKKLNIYKNIKVIEPQLNTSPSYHLILLNINFKKLKKNKNKFIKELVKKNIFLQFHYIPIFKFSFFKKKITLKNAMDYARNTISIPVYHELNEQKINKIVKEIIRSLKLKKY